MWPMTMVSHIGVLLVIANCVIACMNLIQRLANDDIRQLNGKRARSMSDLVMEVALTIEGRSTDEKLREAFDGYIASGLGPAKAREDTDKAYLVISVETATGAIVHVGIYSAPAAQLTSLGHQECNVDGPSATGSSFEDAIRNLLKLLQQVPSYRWMFDRLGESSKPAYLLDEAT